MRKTMCMIALVAAGLFLFQPAVYAADDFFDVIGYETRAGEGDTMIFEPTIYGAKVTGSWHDKDGDAHWDDDEFMAEPIKIYDRAGKLVLETPPSYDRDELEAWAEGNAEKILDTLFPGGITQATGLTDDALMRQDLLSNRSFKKATTQRKIAGIQQLNNDFRGALEYLIVDVNEYDGSAVSAVFGLASELKNRLEIGFMLPYRSSTIDDGIDSTSHFTGLDLYMKYPTALGNGMTLNFGADIDGSVFYLSSDAIKDAGTYKYGAGLFTSFIKDFSSGAVFSIGLDYGYSQSKLEADLVDTDNEFVEEAIDYVNDLDPVHSLSYGFNIGVPLGKMAAANLQAIRTSFMSDDIHEDYENQTMVMLDFSWFPTQTFALNMGIRRVFELEDIDVTGITLGTLYRF